MRNIFLSDVNNEVDARNIYPTAGGATTGTRASAFTPYTAGQPGSEVSPNGSSGATGGFFGKPLSWWFLILVLTVALMWVAQRYGNEKEGFKNVRLSVYNIVVISLAAMIGFGAFKVIFGKVKVPGLSEFVAAV